MTYFKPNHDDNVQAAEDGREILFEVTYGNPPVLSWSRLQNSRGSFLFQFPDGSDPAKPHVGTVVVVCPEPACCVILHLLDGCNDAAIRSSAYRITNWIDQERS